MKKRTFCSAQSIYLSILLILCVAVASTQAALLNLTLDHYPRVHAITLNAQYYGAGHTLNTLPNSSTEGLLHLTANTMQYYEASGDSYVYVSGVFDVQVAVDPATGAGLSGILTVTGLDMFSSLPLPGMDDQDLFYSAALTAFGFGSEDKFEFKFTQQGPGMVAPDGEPIGIIVDARDIIEFNAPAEPDFTLSEWHNTGFAGLSDTFYLPEPYTVLVLALTSVLALFTRRR